MEQRERIQCTLILPVRIEFLPVAGAHVEMPDMEHDQRRHKRFQPQSNEVTVSLDSGVVTSAVILNESFGGIAVRMDTRVDLGDEFEVYKNGVRAWAIVRHVNEEDERRVGLEWKAEGIARKLRNRIEKSALDGVNVARFLQRLPSGLSMLWTLFEHGKWTDLSVLLERMRTEAAVYGDDDLTGNISQLRSHIDSMLDESNDRLMPNGSVPLSRLRSDVDSAVDSMSDIRPRVHESLMQLFGQCTDTALAAIA